jgi:hypothetical protein
LGGTAAPPMDRAQPGKRPREEGAAPGRPVPAPDLRGAERLRALAAPPAEVLLPLPGGLALTFASRTLQVTQLGLCPAPFAPAPAPAPAGAPAAPDRGRETVVAFVGVLGDPRGVPPEHQCAVATAVHPLLGARGRDLFLIAFTRAAVDAGDLGLAGGVWVTPGPAEGGPPPPCGPAGEVPELVRALGDSLRRRGVARTLVLSSERWGGFRVEAERRDGFVRDLSLRRLMLMLGARDFPRPPPGLGPGVFRPPPRPAPPPAPGAPRPPGGRATPPPRLALSPAPGAPRPPDGRATPPPPLRLGLRLVGSPPGPRPLDEPAGPGDRPLGEPATPPGPPAAGAPLSAARRTRRSGRRGRRRPPVEGASGPAPDDGGDADDEGEAAQA